MEHANTLKSELNNLRKQSHEKEKVINIPQNSRHVYRI
jgi:hypothetical protein